MQIIITVDATASAVTVTVLATQLTPLQPQCHAGTACTHIHRSIQSLSSYRNHYCLGCAALHRIAALVDDQLAAGTAATCSDCRNLNHPQHGSVVAILLQ